MPWRGCGKSKLTEACRCRWRDLCGNHIGLRTAYCHHVMILIIIKSFFSFHSNSKTFQKKAKTVLMFGAIFWRWQQYEIHNPSDYAIVFRGFILTFDNSKVLNYHLKYYLFWIIHPIFSIALIYCFVCRLIYYAVVHRHWIIGAHWSVRGKNLVWLSQTFSIRFELLWRTIDIHFVYICI